MDTSLLSGVTLNESTNAMQAAMMRALGIITDEQPATVRKPTKSARVERSKPKPMTKTRRQTGSTTKITKRLETLGAADVKTVPLPTGVVHTNDPKIDELCSHALLERVNGKSLTVHSYYHSTKCDDATLVNWLTDGVWPVDIGSEKYHQNGFASTFVWTMEALGRTPTGAESELAEMLAKNNRTGYLKYGSRYAIARMLRSGHLVDGIDRDELVRRTVQVIQTWLDVREHGHTPPNPASLEEHFGGISRLNLHGDLSVGEYICNLKALGFKLKQLKEVWSWWMRLARAIDGLEEAGENEYLKMDVRVTTVGDFKVAFIKTDNPFVIKAAGKDNWKWHLTIQIQSTGHMRVMKKHFGLDISELGEAIINREPDRWYQQPQTQEIHNSTVQYTAVEPTALTVQDLCDLIRPLQIKYRKSIKK